MTANNRRAVRGAQVYDIAMAWRLQKDDKLLRRLRELLDMYLEEDHGRKEQARLRA